MQIAPYAMTGWDLHIKVDPVTNFKLGHLATPPNIFPGCFIEKMFHSQFISDLTDTKF